MDKPEITCKECDWSGLEDEMVTDPRDDHQCIPDNCPECYEREFWIYGTKEDFE